MTSRYFLIAAINAAIKEEALQKYITLMDKWNRIEMPNGDLYSVKIVKSEWQVPE